MIITLQTPNVFQYPETGRPDEGLEVYIWPNGSTDCFLNGRGILFGYDFRGYLNPHLSPDIRFDLNTKHFFKGNGEPC